jgi:hypothetical protein
LDKVCMWGCQALKDLGEVRQLTVRLKEVGFTSELVSQLEKSSENIEQNYFRLVQVSKQKDVTEAAATEVIESGA